MLKSLLTGIALAFAMLATPAAAQAPKATPDNTLVIELKNSGKVLIQLRPDLVKFA